MKEEKFTLAFYELKLELPVLRYYIESINELKKPMQILEQDVQMYTSTVNHCGKIISYSQFTHLASTFPIFHENRNSIGYLMTASGERKFFLLRPSLQH